MDLILLFELPGQPELIVILIVIFLLIFGKDIEDFFKNN